MSKRTTGLIVSLIIFGFSCYLLITGSSVLTLSLSNSNNIPLGQITTWLGMIALPYIFYFSIAGLRDPKSKIERAYAKILKILIGMAVLWVPISYLLAGNIAFEFTEKAEFQGGQLAMQLFWYFSYFVAAGPILLFLVYGITSIFKRRK